MHFYTRFFAVIVLVVAAFATGDQGVTMLTGGTSLTILAWILIILGVVALATLLPMLIHHVISFVQRRRVYNWADAKARYIATTVLYRGEVFGVRPYGSQIPGKMAEFIEENNWLLMRGRDIYDASRGMSLLADPEVAMLVHYEMDLESDFQIAA